MKILFVSNISWSLFNFRKGLMNELRKRGNDVIFCAVRDDYTSKLQDLGFRYIPIDLDRKSKNILKELRLFLNFIRIYRTEQPDWILHNSTKPFLYGAFAAYLTGNRSINTHSGLGYLFIRIGLFTNLLLVFYKLAGICATKTYFQNKDDLRLFLDKKIIVPEKCVLVPGDGINIDYFNPSGNRRTKEDFVFLFLGRILWDKGVAELIDAIRELKKYHPLLKVNFLGMIDKGNPAGISRAQIEKWIQEGLIRYLGETIDVRPYLNECDCVVLPSYREGIPRALLEASAMELPIIATDVPGCRSVVDDGSTGLLVKVRDARDLARAMDTMMKMPESKRREMGKNGKEKIIREYNEKTVIKAYCAQMGIEFTDCVFDEALASK